MSVSRRRLNAEADIGTDASTSNGRRLLHKESHHATSADGRIVMTLDAGGTNFRFSAIRAGQLLSIRSASPAKADNLTRCLGNIVEGFSRVRSHCPAPPVAISFAFPGPADYPAGIIGDLGNLPGFRGGVALGPMLEDHVRPADVHQQ